MLLTEQAKIHYLSEGGLLPKYIQRPQRVKLMSKLFRVNEMSDDISSVDESYVSVSAINSLAEDASVLATG